MKETNFYMSALMLMGSAFLASCSSETVETANENSGKYNVTATAMLDGTISRVAFTDGGTDQNITTAWQTGENMQVFIDGTVNTLTATSVDDRTATFMGTATSAPIASSTWKAVTGAGAKISSTNIICGYTGQDGSLTSAQKYDYMVISATGASPKFGFSSATKLSYILRLKLPAGVTQIEVNAPKWTVTSSANTSDGVAKNVAAAQSDEIQTITLATATAADGDVRYIAVPAVDYSLNGLILTFFKGESSSTGKVALVNLASVGGKVHDLDFSGSNLTFIDRPTTSVDLGTYGKWAAFNVGAKANPTISTETFGDYYAWGEIETKSSFTWDTYMVTSFAAFDKAGDPIFEWNGSSSKTYNIGGSRFDVARVKWGKEWRMPTNAELENLKDNVTLTCTTSYTGAPYDHLSNTIGGGAFTANNNTVFFPNAGERLTNNEITYGVTGCNYWCSECKTSVPYMYINNVKSFIYFYTTNRAQQGFSVRAVSAQ